MLARLPFTNDCLAFFIGPFFQYAEQLVDIVSRQALEEILAVAVEHDLWVVSDEASEAAVDSSLIERAKAHLNAWGQARTAEDGAAVRDALLGLLADRGIRFHGFQITGDEVTDALRRLANEMPEEEQRKSGYRPGWYHGRFRGAAALNHLGEGFSSSFSSAIASASSPPGSSSGSGGGGSSGGGGGGGGGGGW